jgi:hypothetical protein
MKNMTMHTHSIPNYSLLNGHLIGVMFNDAGPNAENKHRRIICEHGHLNLGNFKMSVFKLRAFNGRMIDELESIWKKTAEV